MLDALVSSLSMWWCGVQWFWSLLQMGFVFFQDVHFWDWDLPGIDCVSAVLGSGDESHVLFLHVLRWGIGSCVIDVELVVQGFILKCLDFSGDERLLRVLECSDTSNLSSLSI